MVSGSGNQHVFISYRRADSQALIGKLYNELARANLNVWIDHSAQNQTREAYEAALEAALKNCNVVLVVLSACETTSNQSDWMDEEFARAVTRFDKPVIQLTTARTHKALEALCVQTIDVGQSFEVGISELHRKLKWMTSSRYHLLRQWIFDTTLAIKARQQSQLAPVINEVSLTQRILFALQSENITLADFADRLNIEVELAEALMEGMLTAADLDKDFLLDIEAALGFHTGLSLPEKAPPDLEPFLMLLPTQRDTTLPTIQWADFSAGEVQFAERTSTPLSLSVNSFRISKALVTQAQYQTFVDAPDGYAELHWWSYSLVALAWRTYSTADSPTNRDADRAHDLSSPLGWLTVGGDAKDRATVTPAAVTWYDAVAFCRWLSSKTELNLRLPNEREWQYVAQQNNPLQPTIHDRAGNVWEWCLADWEIDRKAAYKQDYTTLLQLRTKLNRTYIRRQVWTPEYPAIKSHFRLVEKKELPLYSEFMQMQRRFQQLTQENMANRLNISVRRYWEYEVGIAKPPIQVAQAIEKILELPEGLLVSSHAAPPSLLPVG